MSTEKLTEIAAINAPFKKQLLFQDVELETSLRLIRMRIKEGTRFTIIDFDEETAEQISKLLSNWVSHKDQNDDFSKDKNNEDGK